MEPANALRPQLKVLTSLRFFAAAMVVLYHVQSTRTFVAGPEWYQNFASIGFSGVTCFFVLSGFILVYTYADTQLNIRRFWQARFARIYPAYAFSLLVSLPFFLAGTFRLDTPNYAWSEQHFVTACLLAIGLLQSWVPLAAGTWNPVSWSLSVEAFFYLIFPWLLSWGKYLNTRGLIAGIAACALISLSCSALYFVIHPDGSAALNSSAMNLPWRNVLDFNPAVRLPEFLIGVLSGYLFIGGKVSPRFAGRLVGIGVAVLALLVLMEDRIPRPLMSPGLMAPAFAAIIFGLALRPRWVRFFEGRWLVLLGESSYSLYLLHSLVILIAFNLIPWWPAELRIAFALTAAIGVALLCYALIERPARRLLRPGRRQLMVEAAHVTPR